MNWEKVKDYIAGTVMGLFVAAIGAGIWYNPKVRVGFLFIGGLAVLVWSACRLVDDIMEGRAYDEYY